MSWMDGLRHRIHVWIHADEYAWEQAEERRFHQEMERAEEDGERAHPPAPKPRASASAPGSGAGPSLSPLAEWILQDLGHAVRGLARSPGFTLLAVLTLALGVGANSAVFSVLDRVFGQAPPGLEDPNALRRLYIELPEHPIDPGMIFRQFNYPAFSAVDEAVDGGVAAWVPSAAATIHDGSREWSVRRSYVTHDYFSVLGVSASRGRLFGPAESRVEVPAPVAVISHAFWERAFGTDPGVLGRSIRVDATTLTVIGVAAEGFSGLDLSYADVFLPLSTFPAEGQPDLGLTWYQWVGNYLHAVARIPDPGAEQPLLERATAGYRRQVLPQLGAAPADSTAAILAGSIVEARGVRRQGLGPEMRTAASISVRIGGVSASLLLIACANVAGLLLVRAVRRRREIAVRLALGVSRRRLYSQLLTEGAVLASLAAGAALLLAAWGGSVLRRLLLPGVDWAVPVLDLRTIAFSLSSAVLVGLIAALAPALQARRVDVSAGLKSSATDGDRRGSSFRSGLLIGQAALSVVLLVGAGLFLRSLGKVTDLRLGFDLEELAWISPGRFMDGEEPVGLREEIAAHLASVDGALSATVAGHGPMLGWGMARLSLPGADSLPSLGPGEYPTLNEVSPEFFAVTGTRVLQGRAFTEGEDGVMMVGETMARLFWPGESPLGKCLILREPDAACHTVIAVVEDTRRRVLDPPALHFFIPRPAEAIGGTILLRVDPRRWATIAATAREELGQSFDPESVRMARMADTLEPELRPWRLGAQLFTTFGVLALVVTMVGTYTVIAYTVSQRTREMGIRVALGARLQDISHLVLEQSLKVVAMGSMIGVLLALALGRIVESLLYGVTPRDPVAIAAALATLLLAGMVASLVPAWRAGSVDPVEALSAE